MDINNLGWIIPVAIVGFTFVILALVFGGNRDRKVIDQIRAWLAKSEAVVKTGSEALSGLSD